MSEAPELEFLRKNADTILQYDANVFPVDVMPKSFFFNDGVTLASLVKAGYLRVDDPKLFTLQFTGEAVSIAERWDNEERAVAFLENEGWQFLNDIGKPVPCSRLFRFMNTNVLDETAKRDLKALVALGYLEQNNFPDDDLLKEYEKNARKEMMRIYGKDDIFAWTLFAFTEKSTDIIRKSYENRVRSIFKNAGLDGRETLDIFAEKSEN